MNVVLRWVTLFAGQHEVIAVVITASPNTGRWAGCWSTWFLVWTFESDMEESLAAFAELVGAETDSR